MEKNQESLDLYLIFSKLVSGRDATNIIRTSANITEDVPCCLFIDQGYSEEDGILVNWVIMAIIIVLTQLVPLVLPGYQFGLKFFAQIHRVGL